MKSSLAIPLFLALAAVSTAASASPIVLDMEGIAGPQHFAQLRDAQVPMQGFYMNVPRGTIVGSEILKDAPLAASNGTDHFWHFDAFEPFSFERIDGETFEILSFDSTVRLLPYNGWHEFNFNIEVTGKKADGEIVETTFTVDDQDPYETFSFGPGWTNLTEVMFINPTAPAPPGVVLPPSHNGLVVGGILVFDNFVVVPANTVAMSIPPTVLLFLPALFSLVTIGSLRRRA